MRMIDWEDYFRNARNPYINTNTLTITNEIKPKKTSELEIKNVIFNPPATIVFWADGTKTVVKCFEEDYFSEECGLAMAICKKVYGNDNTFHKIFKKYIKPVEFPYKFYAGTVFNNAYRKFMEKIYGCTDN